MSSQGSPQVHLISDTISILGGPRIDPSDIEWAAHLPAGKKLVQWLADQCVNDHVDGAALRRIALEDEEIKILNHAGGSEISSTTDTIHAPVTYVTPSRLHKHAEYLDAETQLLEAETVVVKSRIRQTKQASQRSTAAAKSLQTAIEREDAVIEQAQERLAELSILADTTLSSTTDVALALLNTLEGVLDPKQSANFKMNMELSETHPSLAPATQSLTALAALRSSITTQHTTQLEPLRAQGPAVESYLHVHPIGDDSFSQFRLLASPELLAAEATFLQEGIVNLLDGSSLRERAYAIELQRICDALATDWDTAMPDLDHEVEPDDVDQNADDRSLNVCSELEKSWALDKAHLLDLEEEILDATIKAYTGKLIPGLTDLHMKLMSHERDVRVAEAWVGALGLEMEGIGEDVERAETNVPIDTEDDAPKKETRSSEAVSGDEDVLEARLKELLLRYDREQPSSRDDGPLVLLNEEDTVQEVQRVQEKVEDEVVNGWRHHKDMRGILDTLSATHHPLLTSVYRHSPMNTSRPFSSSPAVSRLENEAKQAASALNATLGKDGIGEGIEKIIESSRTKRKLSAFVERWCLQSGSGVPRA